MNYGNMDKYRQVDPDIVHQIVVEKERMGNPYADVDTLVEKLESLKPHLIEVARRDNGYTTYMETSEATGIFTARQSRVLGTLGLHEDELRQPLLPAIVVQDTTNPMPGKKYFSMVNATRNWSTPDSDTEGDRRKVWENHVQDVRSHWSE